MVSALFDENWKCILSIAVCFAFEDRIYVWITLLVEGFSRPREGQIH